MNMNIKTSLARPFARLAGEWSRLAPRERRLAAGLGGAVMAVIFVGGWLFLAASLQEIAEGNQDMREALGAISKHKDEYLGAKSRMVAQEVRIGTEPPQFAADLEAAAREAGIQIPDQNEQPSLPAGRRYIEHKIAVKLRQVDLQSLSRFLAKLETGRRLIVVTSMGIRRRFSEGEKLDVELTMTAFERTKEERPIKKRVGSKEKT